MIQSISVEYSSEKSWRGKVINRFDYSKNFPLFQKKNTFQKGLNLIIGGNGSGKTTLIKYLSYYLHCNQGGYSKITSLSAKKMTKDDYDIDFEKSVDLVSIDHDGQCTFFYTPYKIFGYKYGYVPDDDFWESFQKNADYHKESDGNFNIKRFNDFITLCSEKNTIDIPKHLQNHSDFWGKRLKKSIEVLQPSIEQSQKTILMDEPERGLDAVNKLYFVEKIKELVEKDFQIIMVIHCPFLYFMLRDYTSHIIESTQGYKEILDNSLSTIKSR